jgi:hypothetical protein
MEQRKELKAFQVAAHSRRERLIDEANRIE